MCSTAKAIIEHHRLKASAAKSQSLSRSASAGGLTLSRPTAAAASSSSSCSSSTTAAATSTSSSSTLSRPTTTTMMMADCSGSASSSNNTLTMSTAHRMRRAGSSGLIGYHTDCSDDDLESSSHSHVLDRVKSDRMPVTKPEEDRRRRTIIVEKKNHSYGFTLQSYGIHYKKEQEIEMITYVDYVEYDGPAYRSGMREGDVILSINGVDMEKADHKTLVAFIKACDTRMRMVVLFEDCVRKVELHMRYIQLQTVLQGKMNELERTCLRERELLEGKWKTHSLPARKRASATADAQTPADEATSPGADESAPAADSDVPTASPFCRPALSTEDVHQLGRHYRHQYGGVHGHHHQPLPLHYQPLHQLQTMHGVGSATAVIPPPAQFMLTYQYLDPHCRYVLRPSLLLSRGSSGGGGHHHHHHHHHQQQQQQQTPPNGEYYHLNVSPAQAGRTHRKSPSEDHPMTNFGSNESTDEILSDAHPSATQQRHHPHHHHHQSSSAATAAATATESNYAHGKHHQSTAGAADAQKVAATTATTAPTAGRTTKSSSRHCHSGHSCNPCLGHRSKDKSSAAANGGSGAAGGDNVSLDAYDLASPCCDPHCVPTRRRTRHHKDHHHRHKHRDKDQKDAQQQQQQQQQRAQRPRSQSHAASPSMLHANAGGVSSAVQSPHHQRYNDKCQNHRPRFYDITAGLATHCSLHSCTSSEQPLQASANSGVHCVHAGGGGGGGGAESSAASYTTSLSTDTLYWDPELSSGIGGGGGGGGHSRQQSTKSRQSAATVSSVYHPQASIQSQQQYVHQQQQLQQQQQRYHHVQPAASAAGAYECHQTSTAASVPYMNGKPKSWDNLAMKGIGGYGFGYSYLDAGNQMSVAGKPPVLGGVNPLVAGSAAGAKPLPTGGVQHQLFSQQQQQQQQRHSIPRKNPYGRYSTFSDVENYAPPPSQFVHATITTTTITKSTENLIGGGAMNHSDTSLHSCDGCNEPPAGAGGADSGGGGGGGVSYVAQMQSMSPASQAQLQQQQQPKHHDCRGYYSHLPRARIGSSNSGTNGGGGEPGAGSGSAAGSATNSMSRVPAGNSGGHVATVSEVTRL